MTVPLDRLYDFLQAVCNKDIVIYRWMPHGSRKLSDLMPTRNLHHLKQAELLTKVYMICHDQEPLQYHAWSHEQFVDFSAGLMPEPRALAQQFAHWHLRLAFGFARANLYEKTLLCHSELNSKELETYENQNFVGVYYWAHALLARDWFRHAEVDPVLKANKVANKDFLIYNRAWCGTREYRLKFSELLVKQGLVDFSLTSFNAWDGYHYRDHKFKNSTLQIEPTFNLENYFSANTSTATSSADYIAQDYANTNLEVVLETLFDDQRQHLTEKTLRAIACGQPFLLCAPPGSLKYLRQYGFVTFDSVLDEHYDTVTDPYDRLIAVISLMKHIQTHKHKPRLMRELRQIAAVNQQRFFSKEFHQKIIDEFVKNFELAYQKVVASCNGSCYQKYMTAMHQSGQYLDMKLKRDNAQSLQEIELEQQILDNHMSKVVSTALRHPSRLQED